MCQQESISKAYNLLSKASVPGFVEYDASTYFRAFNLVCEQTFDDLVVRSVREGLLFVCTKEQDDVLGSLYAHG